MRNGSDVLKFFDYPSFTVENRRFGLQNFSAYVKRTIVTVSNIVRIIQLFKTIT
jgi:hypothetical protein